MVLAVCISCWFVGFVVEFGLGPVKVEVKCVSKAIPYYGKLSFHVSCSVSTAKMYTIEILE